MSHARPALILARLALAAWLASRAHGPGAWHRHEQRLPTIGPAPDFALTSQDGAPVALRDFRGKVVAVTFIYTSCTDVCPLLTEKMAQVQDELGAGFRREDRVRLDHRRPGARHAGGAEGLRRGVRRRSRRLVFLTGAPAVQRGGPPLRAWRGRRGGGRPRRPHAADLARRPARALRVQYLGYRFDPEEFRRDLVGLAERALMRWGNRAARLVARVPARVQTKLLVAFLAMVGAARPAGRGRPAGARAGVNRQTEELIQLQRKIAAYRQVQHDTTGQLYGVASALLSPDERALEATLRQLNQFGYDLDRLEFVARTRSSCSARSGRTTTGSSRS